MRWHSKRLRSRSVGKGSGRLRRLLESLFHQDHAFLDALAHRPLDLPLTFAPSEQLVGNMERREHGHLQGIYRACSLPDSAHLAVYVSGQLLQIFFVLIRVDVITLVVNVDFHALAPGLGRLGSATAGG